MNLEATANTNPEVEVDDKCHVAITELEILDTEPEREYDDIVVLASLIFECPIAVISFFDQERTWFKARKGIDIPELPTYMTLCSLVKQTTESVISVNDLWWDTRFSMNPLVINDPHIRSYASVPIITKGNHVIGALSVADRVPRDFSEEQLNSLKALANQVNQSLNLRRKSLLLEKENLNLKNLAITDDLTGLFNRRGIGIHAEQQLKNFRSRATDRGMWVMVADLDGLKEINDVYGHFVGSAAIKKAAVLLSSCIRGSDFLGRPSGDEFIAILVNTLDEVALRLPERIQAAFDLHNLYSNDAFELQISTGLVKVQQDDTSSLRDLIRAADRAMYKQKKARRGRVSIHSISQEIFLPNDAIHQSLPD